MIVPALKKVLALFLSLWIISLIIFFISKSVPGDTIYEAIGHSYEQPINGNFEAEYEKIYKRLHFEKPLFYFSIVPRNYPDNMQSIYPKIHRDWTRAFLLKGYNYNEITILKDQLQALHSQYSQSRNTKNLRYLAQVFDSRNHSELIENFNILDANQYGQIQDLSNLKSTIINLKPKRSNLVFPKWVWNGAENQYHKWIATLVSGDAGVSYTSQNSVAHKIKRSLVWTVSMVTLSLILSYIFGVLIGMFLARYHDSWIARVIERILFGIYSVPLFWFATLMLIFFTTDQFGKWTNIFPTIAFSPIDLGEPWNVRLSRYGSQLILPIFCLVLHNLAFLGSLTKRNMLSKKNAGFVMLAKANGYSKNRIWFSEIFPHARIPLITSFTSALPSAISGSLIIEVIFNVPGMGSLLFMSISLNDWPVVYAIVMLIALVTFICFALAELLYRWADPRISKLKHE